jgi:uncharacterized protein YaiI (UPF0178 family)
MSIYVGNISNINITENIKDIGTGTRNSNSNSNKITVIVSSSKAEKADMVINNSLDILLKSANIKDFMSNMNKKGVVFNLEKINKALVK